MRLAAVWIVGALLIAISAAARGSGRLPMAPRPLPTIEPGPEVESAVEVPSFDDVPDRPEPEADVVATLTPVPGSIDESQRIVIEFWRAWRNQAVEALPEGLREKSEHRAAIEETYQFALRNAGIAEGDVEVEESIVNGGLALADLVEVSAMRTQILQVQLTVTSDELLLTEFLDSN